MEIYAHRGHSAFAPENTLPAFCSAINHGATSLECDLHMSEDGRFVVCHDGSINRTSNATGHIKNLTLDRLRNHDFGSWFHRRFSGVRIPIIEEVLRLGPRLSRINIEIKDARFTSPTLFERLYKIISGYGMTGKILVSSFSQDILRMISSRFDDIKTGLLYEYAHDDIILLAKQRGFTAIHPKYKFLSEPLVRRAHDEGLEVNVWTVNSRAKIKRCIELRADGIITNHPYRAKKLVENMYLSR